MFRQLIGLVLLSLAAFGIAPAQANTDEAYVLESPPVIEIREGITVSGTSTRAEPLQPTFSTAFSASSNRVFYDLKIDVLTNGDLDNFDVISACFFISSEADRTELRDTLCGYSATSPMTSPTDPDPSKALSMAWTTGDGFRIDGTNSHELGESTHSTLSTTRNVNSTTITYHAHRLNFQFALSHAALNVSDWTVRVVGVSTPTPKDGDESPPGPQRTELLLDTKCASSYPDQVDDVGCGTPDYYGVSFFGGFSSSTNRSVDYGSVNENSSSTLRTGIQTGDYFANDIATLTIAASDFTAGDDVIPLIATSIGAERNTKQITLACNGDEDLLLSSTVQDFYLDEPRSSADGGPEAAKAAPFHECQLHYGFGASYANSTYRNVVQVGIKDADTTNGPTASAVEITPTP